MGSAGLLEERDMITRFFAVKLAQVGYPANGIRHCMRLYPDTGMAFYGPIQAKGVETVAARMDCVSLRKAIKQAIVKGVKYNIERINWGTADDWNNMIVTYSCDGCDLTLYERSAVEVVRDLLQEDVRVVSQTLEKQGRAIINGTPEQADVVREFRTRKFLVRVIEVPDRNYNPLDRDDEAIEIVDKIANGEYRYYAVVVEIRALSTGALLAKDLILGIVESKTDPARDSGYYGNLRHMVATAAREARTQLSRLDLLAA
jgi:disulfide oxidoreductase YuzD